MLIESSHHFYAKRVAENKVAYFKKKRGASKE